MVLTDFPVVFGNSQIPCSIFGASAVHCVSTYPLSVGTTILWNGTTTLCKPFIGLASVWRPMVCGVICIVSQQHQQATCILVIFSLPIASTTTAAMHFLNGLIITRTSHCCLFPEKKIIISTLLPQSLFCVCIKITLEIDSSRLDAWVWGGKWYLLNSACFQPQNAFLRH